MYCFGRRINMAEKKTETEEKKPETIADFVKLAKETSRERKFSQTWDFTINLSGLDLKKPENRFNIELQLPGGRGKDVKVAVIADTLATEAKKHADLVITKAEIAGLVKNKAKLKKIANTNDWFLAEMTLMPLIGKTFGPVLGMRGKMPKPVPPKVGLEPLVALARRSIRVRLKEAPVIHIPVGTDKMPAEDVAKNVQAVFNAVKDKLPKGINNIKSMQIKLTMGKPVKVDIR
jgi:large subunit ribosomal protein L1